MYRVLIAFCFLIHLTFLSCSEPTKKVVKKEKAAQLFSSIPTNQSNVTFRNDVTESVDFNFLTYPYIYIGGGVAVGDINNDELPDIYFIANQGENKLYLNKGDFVFEDITKSSGTQDQTGWSTGVSMVDINNDGWMDIYICKSASTNNPALRKNVLYINNQDGTFTNKANAYGLADAGFSTQSYFLDYDKDGDLDMYLVNHRPDFQNNGKIDAAIQKNTSPETSDQLYKNNGNNTFTNVSIASGILNKAWGLSAAIGDYNNDGWHDIYVCNDYLEPDMLYINNQNGTFSNQTLSRMNHISFNSMGSDLADINNDGHQDLIVLDMLAEDHERGKENMATMSTANFWSMVDVGYHHQYMSNMLQMNDGNGFFSEVGQLAGINKTDWSWAPLFADFDNDGMKDLFVTNGIYKDLGNQDFRRNIKAKNQKGESMTLDGILNMAPSSKLSNKAFKNTSGYKFENSTKEWGLDTPTFSNGVAYGDFDADGDLDLVINNYNSEALIYRNDAHLNAVQFKLKGFPNNDLAIGSKITLTVNGEQQYQELFLSRGFESSVENIVSFGIGINDKVDQVTIQWPNGETSVLNTIAVNTTTVVDYANSTKIAYQQPANEQPLFTSLDPKKMNIHFQHKENEFNDYDLQLLLPQKKSTQGAAIAVGDVNNDGKDDFFVGNAANESAALYLQKDNGQFELSTINQGLWNKENRYEDTGAFFFDADNDNDLDLYVVSAGYELNKTSSLLQDRLYINLGDGRFTRKANLPKMHTSGKSVAVGDYDKDGDMDLFVAGNIIPGEYPLTPKSYLLENNNGVFKNVTEKRGKELSNVGLINDAKFLDIDNDNDLDLVLAGEWMPITVYKNNNGNFELLKNAPLDTQTGWWSSITAADFDKDGDLDIIVGNLGNNNKFHPSEKKPLHVYGKDFDENGTFDVVLSKMYKGRLVPVRGKECSSEQNPFLLDKIKSYKEFATSGLEDIYGDSELAEAFHLKATKFESVYLENDGNGLFTMIDLPEESQFGPTLAATALDVNNDGHMDIIGTGNLFNAEVETIRYDASKGYVLLGDSDGNFKVAKNTGIYNYMNSKDIKTITVSGKKLLLVSNNNGPIQIYILNN